MSDSACMDCGETAGVLVSFDAEGTQDGDCLWLCVECCDSWRHPNPIGDPP